MAYAGSGSRVALSDLRPGSAFSLENNLGFRRTSDEYPHSDFDSRLTIRYRKLRPAPRATLGNELEDSNHRVLGEMPDIDFPFSACSAQIWKTAESRLTESNGSNFLLP